MRSIIPPRILLTHSPEALANYYGERALAGLSLETVAQAAEIIQKRIPKGAVNGQHWTRKVLLK